MPSRARTSHDLYFSRSYTMRSIVDINFYATKIDFDSWNLMFEFGNLGIK
jgi:hypothetical protein